MKEILGGGETLYGVDAVKLGLIDEVTTPEEYFNKRFAGSSDIQIRSPESSFFQKLMPSTYFDSDLTEDISDPNDIEGMMIKYFEQEMTNLQSQAMLADIPRF